jgi:hypothetical protein
MHYLANDSREVYTATRPFRCGGFWCCPQRMTLREAGSGRVLGEALENFTPWCSKVGGADAAAVTAEADAAAVTAEADAAAVTAEAAEAAAAVVPC